MSLNWFRSAWEESQVIHFIFAMNRYIVFLKAIKLHLKSRHNTLFSRLFNVGSSKTSH